MKITDKNISNMIFEVVSGISPGHTDEHYMMAEEHAAMAIDDDLVKWIKAHKIPFYIMYEFDCETTCSFCISFPSVKWFLMFKTMGYYDEHVMSIRDISKIDHIDLYDVNQL